MDQDRTDVLMAKYLAGELSPEENEELEWAMLANPTLRVTLQVLQRMRQVPGESTREEQDMMVRGLERLRGMREPAPVYEMPVEVLYREGKERKRRINARWWMAAAAILVLGVAGVMLFPRNKPGVIIASAPILDKEITTRYGTRSFLELPDGSKLWLNAGSKVKYADGFANGRRELTLTGEAFFDVKHDPEHPFIIHTGRLDIKVLGTSFNVKAYPNDSTIETTLIKGKVEIDLKGDPQSNIVLQPNEKVVIPVKRSPAVHTTENEVLRRTVTPDPTYRTLIETSWVEDKLVFRNETFSDVTMRLERWYNIHFSFEDQRFMQDKLTGYFKDQPIKNVMDALQISLGFHYRIDKDTIRIW
jgi:ferric-dicitrate binding protein FerR (iron transport regulator)